MIQALSAPGLLALPAALSVAAAGQAGGTPLRPQFANEGETRFQLNASHSGLRIRSAPITTNAMPPIRFE